MQGLVALLIFKDVRNDKSPKIRKKKKVDFFTCIVRKLMYNDAGK